MYRNIIKSVLREIRFSLGRFFAIVAIFALGVGFYAGLYATMPDMKHSVDVYYNENNLYDLTAMSTYGFTKDEAESILDIEGVSGVMPEKSLDALANGSTVRIASMPDGMNTLTIVQGRLPQAENECVVGYNTMHGTLAEIGGQVVLSDENEADTLDSFVTDTFTVVGIVKTPGYISNNLGTTSIGQGVLNQFMYIPESGFDMEYYTQVYITLNSLDGLETYTEQYESKLESEGERIGLILEDSIGNVQLERVKAEAQSELDEGTNEYNQQKADADREFSDAKAELDQALSEIESGERELEQNEQQLEDGRAEILQRQNEANAELEAAYQTISDNEQQLALGISQYEAALSAVNEAGSPPEQLAAIMAQLEQEGKRLEAAKTELEAAKAEYETQKAQTEATFKQLLDEMDANSAQLDKARAQLQSARREYSQGLSEYNQQKADADAELGEAKAELDDAQREIDELEKPEWYRYTRSDNSGVSQYGQDADRIDSVAKVFPVLFYLVAALVCLTTMTRMVDEQRTQLGTFYALGYTRSAITAKYLIYASMAALGGSAIGAAIGLWLFPSVIYNAYRILYALPDLVLTFNAGSTLFAAAAAILLTCAVTLWACTNTLRQNAAQLMRPVAPKSGKKVLLERITPLWKRMNFTSKVTVRNLFRYKKRFFMTIIGIAGCCGLMLTGFGLKDSIMNIVPKQYGEITQYDLMAYLGSDDDKAEAAIAEVTDNSMYIMQKAADIEMDGTDIEGYVFVPEQFDRLDDFIKFKDRSTNQPVEAAPDGQVVIVERIASKLGVKAGDTVSVTVDGKTAQLLVSGITENYIYNYVYLSEKTFGDSFSEPVDFNQVMLNVEGDTAAAAEKLLQNDSIEAVMQTQTLLDSFSDMFDSLYFVIVVLIVCASLLAFVVLYNLTNINIGERKREIATLKVLGFYPLEADAYLLRENIALTIIGTAFGLVLGVFLNAFVVKTAEMDMVMFTRDIMPQSFVFAALLTFIFAGLVNFVVHFKIKKINMTESLKSVE